MVQDALLALAVSAIPHRSERQNDIQKLVGSFVDVGILPQVTSINNQVLYGRRGTGKTHILRVLGSRLGIAGNVVVYVDCRTLGSTSQFTDATVPLPARCLALFRDVLGEIHSGLLDYIIATAPAAGNQVLTELDDLASAITSPVTTYAAESIDQKISSKQTGKSSGEASLTPTGAKVALRLGSEAATEQQQSTRLVAHSEDKIIFPSITTKLKRILDLCSARLYLLIDEWSSLPIDVQPYLAEFSKRSFFALPSVTLKIASLEHRSAFGLTTNLGTIGFEMGADISAALDIDDYYVYDRNPQSITDSFADMLHKHLLSEVPADHLVGMGVSNGKQLASKLFSERKVFDELVRAAEGVARDLINIFSKAYYTAHRKGKEKIERGAVLDAARQWFEQDKQRDLDDTLRTVLQRITDEVIGERKARSFLLPRELGNHPVIQKLFDLRVLHLVQRGYADKDRPGVRYNIYTLDYGTYVDLMNTTRKPDLGFTVEPNYNPEEYIVPFDDRRSIRRIILTENILK